MLVNEDEDSDDDEEDDTFGGSSKKKETQDDDPVASESDSIPWVKNLPYHDSKCCADWAISLLKAYN